MATQRESAIRRTDLIAAVVAIICLLVASLLGYRAVTGFLGLADDLTRVVVPGTVDLTLESSGDYTIFYEHRSQVDGRAFNTPESLEGLRISITSRETGSLVSLSTPGSDVEYSVRGRSGYSALGFSVNRPGTYELTAFYEGTGQGPDVVLAIGQGVGRALVMSMVAGIAAFFIVLAGVAATLALTLVPRYRRR